MSGIRSLLTPPSGASPRETLEWARRFEIVSGLGAIVMGIVLWDEGWWHWVLIAVGVVSLVPWVGVSAVLRKADRDPTLLDRTVDPDLRRQRVRRSVFIMIPTLVLSNLLIGYLLEGWGAGIFMAILAAIGGGLGARWSLRQYP